MASIQERKDKNGKTHYRVQVRLKGYPPQTETFDRLTDAKKWVQDTESAIREGRYFKTTEAKKHTLGFWAALEEEFPQCRQQRCWVHKTANILDKMPKSVQPNAKRMIHEMYLFPTKETALKAYDEFLQHYAGKYHAACKCLERDKEQLFSFYDFPAEHWKHIRTTNPIESTFATVRHRTRQTKGCGNRVATLTMVYKLVKVAEKGWIRLKGFALLSKVVAGIKFKDGEEVIKERVA